MADTASAILAHVPAAAGTDLVIFDADPIEFPTKENVEVSRVPIVAWRIFEDGSSVPIMAGIFALEFSSMAKYLGAPDGRIYDMRAEIWHADIDAAKANFLAGEQVIWRARHGQSPEGRA
jgi:hypothetical protein